MCDFDVFLEEDSGGFTEFLARLGCEVLAGTLFCDTVLHLRMSLEVGFEALCYVFTLRHQCYTGGCVLPNLWKKEWIVCATENDCVDEWVGMQEFIDAVFYEVIGSGSVVFSVFNERNPHGTGLSDYGSRGVEFFNLQHIWSG